MLEDLLLKAIKIICLIRQGLNLGNRNIKWDLLTAVSMRLLLNDWNYRTPITDILNLEENNLDYKKSCLCRRKFSEIRKYEMFMSWEK